MRHNDDETTLSELATRAIALGRQLEAEARALWLSDADHGVDSVRRTLARVGQREAFDARDDHALLALGGIIDSALAEETTQERRRVETYYDENGQHYAMRDVPVYSARGARLLALRDIYDAYIAARASTQDRLAAERLILEHLRGR